MLGEMGIPQDSATGRRHFEAMMEVGRHGDEPGEWRKVRRGWCLGDEQFRQELLAQMEGKQGRNHGGKERLETDEAHAERLLVQELKRLRWAANELADRRKGDAEKVRIARRLRGGTTMTLDWIAKRLHMGTAGYAATCLRQSS